MTIITEPAPPRTFRLSRGGIAVLVGGVLIAVGSLLTWARLSAVLIGTRSFPGTVGGGRLTAIFGVFLVLGGITMQFGPYRRWVLGVCLLSVIGTLAVGVYNFFDISGVESRYLRPDSGLTVANLGSVSIGVGLYLVLIGAMVAGIGLFVPTRVRTPPHSGER